MNLTINVIQFNGTGVPPIDLVVDLGGIVIGSTSNSSNSATHTTVVPNNTSVEISVSQNGYHSYNMSINDVYTDDKVIFIMMVPIVIDINDPDYNRPNAMHFFFKDPCSFKVDYYSATSFGGNISWYVNNQLYGEGTSGTVSFCSPGNFQLKQRTQTFNYTTGPCPQEIPAWDRQWANSDEPIYLLPGQLLGQGETGNITIGDVQPIEAYLGLDTQTNLDINEFKPSFTLTISSPANQLEDSCCYTRGEDVRIVPNIELNRPGSDPALYYVEYNVTAPNGTTVFVAPSAIPLNAVNLFAEFNLEMLGTYEIEATLYDTVCGNSFTRNLQLETCNFIVLNYVDCNTYSIENKSSYIDATVSISDINGESVLEEENLLVGNVLTVSFENISLYTVTVDYVKEGEPAQEVYVLNNYCGLDECISTYILDILCDNTKRCDPCPDEVELNQMLLLSYTYFMQLNKEYGWNNFYSGLTDTKLAELAGIKQTMDRLLEFCKRRGCISQTSFTKKSNVYDVKDNSFNSIKGCKTCK